MREPLAQFHVEISRPTAVIEKPKPRWPSTVNGIRSKSQLALIFYVPSPSKGICWTSTRVDMRGKKKTSVPSNLVISQLGYPALTPGELAKNGATGDSSSPGMENRFVFQMGPKPPKCGVPNSHGHPEKRGIWEHSHSVSRASCSRYRCGGSCDFGRRPTVSSSHPISGEAQSIPVHVA